MCSIQYNIRLFEGSRKTQGTSVLRRKIIFLSFLFHNYHMQSYYTRHSPKSSPHSFSFFFFFVYFLFFFLEKELCDKTMLRMDRVIHDPFHGQSMRIDTRIQTRAYPFSNISLRWFFSIINSPIVSLSFFFFSYPFGKSYSPIGMYIYIYIYTRIYVHTISYISKEYAI